jgi:hypothetical protein
MTASEPNMDTTKAGTPLSGVLNALAQEPGRARISVGELLSALGDRAVGALMFIFAVPNVFPVPPGTSAILGAPLVFLAAQLMLGRSPWLPSFVANRSMTHLDFSRVVRRAVPWLQRAEKMLRPRLTTFALPPMEYAIGLVCLLLAVVLILPIPLGNILPALTISVLALAVLERDGLWVLAGLAIAAAAAALVSGVVYAMIKGTIYFFVNVLQ